MLIIVIFLFFESIYHYILINKLKDRIEILENCAYGNVDKSFWSVER